MKNFKLSHLPVILWTILSIVFPLFILIFFALTNKNGYFTFNNILQIFNYWKILLRSLMFATITTLACLIIALPFSYFIFKTLRQTSQKLIVALITLPTWTNLLIRTFAWMTLIENNGLINKFLLFIHMPTIKLINTPVAVILVMIYDFLPFMILPIYSSINKINKNILNASYDLGANEFQTFKRVILPMSKKGIFQGVGAVFMFSCSTFIIPRMMSGGTTILIGDLIETQFLGLIYNPWFGSALAIGLNVVIILIIAITNKLTQSNQGELKHEAEFFL